MWKHEINKKNQINYQLPQTVIQLSAVENILRYEGNWIIRDICWTLIMQSTIMSYSDKEN